MTIRSIIFALLALLLSGASVCQRSYSAPVAASKVLHFPTKYPIGKLYLLDKPLLMETNIHARFWRRAQGEVVIPPKSIVYFEAEGGLFQHPENLLKLPPDAFDYIRIQFTSLDKSEEQMSDNAMKFVRHLSKLKVVSLDRSDTTDVGASALAGFDCLESVSFSESLVTGTCLPKLNACKKLSFIRFAAGQIDNDQLRHLKNFPLLKRMTLSRCGLTMSGLKHVSECAGIRNLDIGHNRLMDDKCIPIIQKMRNLSELNLSDTRISFNGMMQLKKQKIKRITFPATRSEYSAAQLSEIFAAFSHVDFKIG